MFKYSSRMATLALGVCVVLVFFHIWYWQPFWRLMDDQVMRRLAGQIASEGFWSVAWKFFVGDLHWGMVRATFLLIPLLVYMPFPKHPEWVSMANAAFVFGASLLLNYALAKALKLVKGSRSLFESSTSSIEITCVLMLATLAFPHFHDSFFYPSLQEKVVFLFGASGLLFLKMKTVRDLSQPVWAAVSLLCLSVGFATKGQFSVLLPAFVILQGVQVSKPLRDFRTLWIAGVGVLWMLGLRWLGSAGSYTSRFGLNLVWQNVQNPYSGLLIGLVFWNLVLAWRFRPVAWVYLLAASTTAIYLVLFLQWSVSGYLLIAASTGFALSVLVVIYKLPQRFRSWGVIALSIVAVSVTFLKEHYFLSRSADIRRIVLSSQVRDLAEMGATVYMTCLEGSEHLAGYVLEYTGLTLRTRAVQVADVKNYRGYWVGDRSLCPLEIGKKVELLAPLCKGGFGVYRD